MHVFLVNLPKVLLPLLGIVLLVKVSPRRGLDLREDLGIRVPAFLPAVSWFAAWIALTAAEEVIGRRLGIGLAKPWPPYSAVVIIERILAIGIMGPIAEEIAFRGMLLGWLQRRINPSGTVVVVAACWTLSHFWGRSNHVITDLYRRIVLGVRTPKNPLSLGSYRNAYRWKSILDLPIAALREMGDPICSNAETT